MLEAVRVFASRGSHAELTNILMDRDEHSLITDDDGHHIAVPDASALFFGRRITRHEISIGSPKRSDIVRIHEAAPSDDQIDLLVRMSLGDGAVRLLSVALALANSAGGFLIIDEAANGIHHSIQRGFWRMIMETAHQNGV